MTNNTFFVFLLLGLTAACGDLKPTGDSDKDTTTVVDQTPPIPETPLIEEQCLQALDCANPVVISGRIEHDKERAHQHPGDFAFTPESHAIVRLEYVAAEDGPSEIVRQLRFSHLSALPLQFSINGEAAMIFSKPGRYILTARVFSGAGDNARIGDLVSEISNPVTGPQTDLVIELTALEPCTDLLSGGYCI